MWKDYFDFTWSERIAIRILLGILIALLIWRVVFLDDSDPVPGDYSELRAAISAFEDSLQKQEEVRLSQLESSRSKFSNYQNDKTNQSSFQSSGAIDNHEHSDDKDKKEDAHQYYTDKKEDAHQFQHDKKMNEFRDYKKEYNYIDLNACNDSDLQQLPGIAAVLSKRILTYRDKLGGFYSIHQLKEVYGLKPETYALIEEYLSADPTSLKKLSVNFAGKDELAKHPYIGKPLSSKILDYRNKTGFIQSLQQLVNDSIIPDSLYQKLMPYLRTD